MDNGVINIEKTLNAVVVCLTQSRTHRGMHLVEVLVPSLEACEPGSAVVESLRYLLPLAVKSKFSNGRGELLYLAISPASTGQARSKTVDPIELAERCGFHGSQLSRKHVACIIVHEK